MCKHERWVLVSYLRRLWDVSIVALPLPILHPQSVMHPSAGVREKHQTYELREVWHLPLYMVFKAYSAPSSQLGVPEKPRVGLPPRLLV